MKICSRCRDEFRDDVMNCIDCGILLVRSDELSAPLVEKKSAREALADQPCVSLLEGTLESCREVERLLQSADVPSFIEVLASEQTQNLGSAQMMRCALRIAEADIPRAAVVLQGNFASMVKREGRGQMMAEPIDLSLAEISCPACGHVGELKDGACVECDLFLGEPG